jgi:tetratricopeptide (TPR) repeat protein
VTFRFFLSIAIVLAACGPPAEAGEHVRRGDAALAAGKYAQSLAAFARARDLAPHDAQVLEGLTRARLHLIAAEPNRITPELVDEARYDAEVLLEKDPSRASIYLTVLAHLLRFTGDVEGGKAKLEEAVKADASNVHAQAALGHVRLAAKDVASAKTAFEAALKAKADHPQALVGLAQVASAEGDLGRAAQHVESALEVRDDFGARMMLGGIRVQQQKPLEAVPQFQRAAELDPKSADALGSLGQALLSAGRAEDAERALRGALELRPDPASTIALGFALVRQKKSEPALSVFGQVLARDATAAPALYGAAMANDDLGRKDKALELYQRLLSIKTSGTGDAMVADMQKDARHRVAALEAASPAASGSAAAGPPRKPK